MSARLAIAIASFALCAALPAHAQHHEHATPAPAAATKPEVDPHAGHVMPAPAPAPRPQSKPKPKPKPAPKTATDPDPHAGHAMPAPQPAVDPHAGHVMPAAQPAVDPHAGHAPAMPLGAPRTPIPALTDADRAAAFPPAAGHAAHDDTVHSFWLIDHLEAARVDGEAGFGWEADAWIGGDVQRLWLRSEGEGRDGDVEAADLELLYGRGVTAWWDVVAGVRHAWGDGPSRTTLAVGVQGLAPYKIPVEATLYVGDGRASARVEAGYETLLTPRWIVQWEASADLHAGADRRRGEGSGLATVAAGARLRYEVTRRFAPYLGVERERAFGATADLRRAAGEEVDDTRVVAGLRFWF